MDRHHATSPYLWHSTILLISSALLNFRFGSLITYETVRLVPRQCFPVGTLTFMMLAKLQKGQTVRQSMSINAQAYFGTEKERSSLISCGSSFFVPAPSN
jgi:hypothetical protein